MFVGDWFGRVKVFDSVEDTTPTLAVDIALEVHSFGDRGMLGMKLDPEFGTVGHNFIYLAYAYDQAMGSLTPPKAEYSDGGDNCKNESPYTDCLISGRVVRVALNPTTGIAEGGANEPPQQALVQSWCQQFNSHSMGDIEFDASGALLVSGGEGANYAEADYGQFGNPCGDPANEGGSLRAQDVLTPSPLDQTDYSGSIIRIDPATGEALPGNPLFASTDVRARRILAFGFRNPFRFEIRPGTSEIYVGDVGQNDWEELDRFSSPPPTAPDFGWPCYEGASGANQVSPAWKSLAEADQAPPCKTLYEAPGTATAPIWAYGHSNGNPLPAGLLFSGDICDPSPGAAFSGLAFYQAAGVPTDALYPAPYQGALFMADAARGCIWSVGVGAEGKPDLSSIANFATGDISPVDIVEGPDGALYAPNFYDDSIEQIRYFGSNLPPTAALTADKIDGEMVGGEFTVKFDAGSSSDPESDPIHYAWDLDGDGQFDDGSDQPTAERTYTEAKNVVVKVEVSDAFDRSDVASLTVYPGDKGPPVPVIDSIDPSADWAVGDTIAYAGSATDPDGGAIPGSTLKWKISIQHCPGSCHEHPYTEPEGASGSFTAPPHEYPSHLRFELTATDSRDRSVTTAPVDIFPRVVEVGLRSEPAGIPVTFDGETAAAGPFKLIAGSTAAVLAPATATVGGVPYAFSSWSDGGAASHQFTGLQSTELVARYQPVLIGGTVGPKPEPPVFSKVRLTIASQPPGVKLRVGKVRRRAPFMVSARKGSAVALSAPRSFARSGDRLAFRGWRVKGTLKKSASLRVVARGNARYVAIYAAG
ncbi:MAG TPA: PQQ-dependent sugar dehydrogenase [Solirubrobacterales bacterium]|nr:PQQ-dependent sugar dehydrogenase [Solirubrobacterales bacterium]